MMLIVQLNVRLIIFHVFKNYSISTSARLKYSEAAHLTKSKVINTKYIKFRFVPNRHNCPEKMEYRDRPSHWNRCNFDSEISVRYLDDSECNSD